MFHFVAEIMTLLCCAILIPVSLRYVQMNMSGFSPSMRLPFPLVYSCLPVGLILSTLASINNICKMLFIKEGD